MAYLYIHHHMSTDDIGLAYGIRGSTVAMYLREQGIEIRANTLDLDENKIKKLRAQGYGIAKLHRRWVALPLPCESVQL